MVPSRILILVAPVLFLSVLAQSSEQNDSNDRQHLDFLQAEYQVGVTYVRTTEINHSVEMDFAGEEANQVAHIEIDTEMSVAAIPSGGKELDILYTRVALSTDLMGEVTEYDSDFPGEGDPTLAASLAPLVGQTFSVVIDDENQVAEAINRDNIMESFSSTGANTVHTSQSQVQKMLRLTKALPEMPVAAGDSWEVDFDLDEMIQIQGTAALTGYVVHEGHSCAVLTLNCSIAADLLSFAHMLGADENFEESMEGSAIKDGKVVATIYFDNEAKFARYTEWTQTWTLQMKSPLDGTPLEMPMRQEVTENVDMKE